MKFACFVALSIILLFTGVDVAAVSVQAMQSTSPSTASDLLFWIGLGGGVAVFGATLSANALTLADWAKRLDPDGKTAAIVELLSQTNEILQDMVWREGNLPTGHRTTVRTGLPTVAWRLINSGVTPSKSTTAQIDEQAGIMEAWSEVDKDLIILNGNEAATRMSEARAFIEAMNQEMASTLFYGNVGLAPEEFTGLAPRYSSLSAGNATNIIDAGGTGSDNTSLWLVAWDEETISGIFPKGSKAGLIHEDYGEVTVEVTAGLAGQRMRALQERWQWKAGIALKDWRYVVRVANIDVSDLGGGAAAALIDAMENAEEILPNELGRKVWYGNRTVFRYLRKQIREGVSSGGGITYENIGGKRVRMFGDTIVRRVDAILNTEARVI